MKLLDGEDTTCRYHGHGFQVVFYCHTCQAVLCPRCLTKGQSSHSTDHMSHVYVEIKDAVDMVKDDLDKILQKLRDDVEQKKIVKIKLQNRAQTLKLELLRQKTLLNRLILRLEKTIENRRIDFRECLATFIQQPIERIQCRINSAESNINQAIEILRMAESLQWLGSNQSLEFLRAFSLIKSACHPNIGQASGDRPQEVGHDSIDKELLELSSLDLSVKRQLNLVSQIFLFPERVPSVPKILKSWCTIGSHSASMVWICNSNRSHIDSFLLYYRTAPENSNDLPSSEAIASMNHEELNKAGLQCIRITKFLPKRSSAVLRNLVPNTNYVLAIFSVNCFARSQPCVTFLKTLESRNENVVDQKSQELFVNKAMSVNIRDSRTSLIRTCRIFLYLTPLCLLLSLSLVYWSDMGKARSTI